MKRGWWKVRVNTQIGLCAPETRFLLKTWYLSLAVVVALGGCAQPVSPPTPLATGFPTRQAGANETEPTTTLAAMAPPITEVNTALPTFAPTLAGATATDVLPVTPISEAPTIPAPPQAHTQYQIEASLDYAMHTLEVQQQVTYTNVTTASLSEIPLMVEAQRYAGAFQFEQMTWQDGSRITWYRLSDIALTLPLPQPLPPGKRIHFSLFYRLNLPYSPKLANIRPYPLGYTDTQANLGDWYPFIPPYVAGQGWLAHKPGFYGEHLAYDIADYRVAIRQIGTPHDLVYAAGVPAEIDGEWQRYYLPAGRSFAWSASPYYQVITQTVELPSGAPVLVESYFFSAYEVAAHKVLQTSGQALSIYTNLFGAYPRSQITTVQADFLDGMEYDGLFFLSRDFYNWHKEGQEDMLSVLSAHEVSHQWWYMLVGSDQALQPWLDEALATYCERLYLEQVAPQALDWWWTYRVNYYQPGGWIDMTIYGAPDDTGRYRNYRDTVYLNGALFLEELRGLVGDQAFFAALKEYVQTYAYRQATAAGFFEIVARHSEQDLGSLLNRYFKQDPR